MAAFLVAGWAKVENLAGKWPEIRMTTIFECDEILAIGGSWIAPQSVIQAHDWVTIAKNPAEAMRIFREIRG
jgi:2-keto-3-deoxy-6-phosphogluconate aldolase